jgi:YD repeat-containing protein
LYLDRVGLPGIIDGTYFKVAVNPLDGNYGYDSKLYDVTGKLISHVTGEFKSYGASTITSQNLTRSAYQHPVIDKEYDSLGNLIKETDGEGNATHYFYDARNFRIAIVDAEGISGTSLAKGMKQTVEESEKMDKKAEKHFITYTLMKNRDAAFDPKHPEKFLDLSEIPVIKDEDDDYEVRSVDLRYEEEMEEEPSEPWASSLPELQNWNESISESSSDDSELLNQNFEDDPVYRLLEPFTHNLIGCLKRDYLWRIKESGNEGNHMRSPLENYLVILALKAQVRLSSCEVLEESLGHEAPRKGVYLFTMECLERIADAIEKFSQEHLYHLAVEARNIKRQIECLNL